MKDRAGGSTTDELCCLTLIKLLSLRRESDSDVFLPLRGGGGGNKKNLCFYKKQKHKYNFETQLFNKRQLI